MINWLSQAGAKAIVYDCAVQPTSQDPAADEALAAAVARSGKVYLLQFPGALAPERRPADSLVMPLPTIANGAAAVGLVHVRLRRRRLWFALLCRSRPNGPELGCPT